jgi:Uma2 family endonuclease
VNGHARIDAEAEAMVANLEATIEDLYAVKGKAEIVNGEIVHMSPTGAAPSYAALEIALSLRDYCKRTRNGYAVGDNVAFHVKLPNRKSFSPDAAYHIGKWPGMKFFEGAPIFAVEVRSEGDYGPAAERAMAEKRADYFAAGTLIIWDVDLRSDDVVKSYRAGEVEPGVFGRGQTADAEPAVPGWSMPVDDLFIDEELEN